MRTRLKDVARQLDLSPGLVSGVLNRRPNVWASPETRRRILHAVEAMNYQPSAAAQALSRGKTQTVSLVYRRLEGTQYRLAYTGIVDTLSEALQARSYGLSVANFADQAEVLTHLRRLARSHACDAVVLWGREDDTGPQAELLEDLGMPFLVKGRHEMSHPRWHQIDFDHEAMTAQAVAHLANLGHRQIAYLGFPLDEAFVHGLRRGFAEGCEAAFGESPEPELIAACEDEVAPNEAVIKRWLGLPAHQRPTAFVIGAGNAAWHALETCLAQKGRKLGQGPNDFGAAGITSLFFTLLFGQAMVYQGIEIDQFARVTAPRMLAAILDGTPADPVVRFRPELTPAPTLNLLNNGVSFATCDRFLPSPLDSEPGSASFNLERT